jgi:hypothetical protein
LALKSVALKVNSLPFKVKLSLSALGKIAKFHITTADVSTPENRTILIKLTTSQDFNKDDVIFSITNADQFEIVKVRALVVVSVSGSVALRVPITNPTPLSLARVTLLSKL